jgi:hypothetical protein
VSEIGYNLKKLGINSQDLTYYWRISVETLVLLAQVYWTLFKVIYYPNTLLIELSLILEFLLKFAKVIVI